MMRPRLFTPRKIRQPGFDTRLISEMTEEPSESYFRYRWSVLRSCFFSSWMVFTSSRYPSDRSTFATPSFRIECGRLRRLWRRPYAFLIMASMSPTGSELGISSILFLNYHEALRRPGTSALFASIRRQSRQTLNLRWYPRRRPQIEQRL